jgi:hypothetical protein
MSTRRRLPGHMRNLTYGDNRGTPIRQHLGAADVSCSARQVIIFRSKETSHGREKYRYLKYLGC